MKVYLAHYDTGFIDDAPELLGICATKEIADRLIEEDKIKAQNEGRSEWHGASRYVNEHDVIEK